MVGRWPETRHKVYSFAPIGGWLAATCLYLKASGVGADGNEMLSTTIMERHTMTRRTRRLAMLFWFIRRK